MLPALDLLKAMLEVVLLRDCGRVLDQVRCDSC